MHSCTYSQADDFLKLIKLINLFIFIRTIRRYLFIYIFYIYLFISSVRTYLLQHMVVYLVVLKHYICFDNWPKKKKNRGENCFVLLGKACIDDSTSLHPTDVITLLLTTGVLCRGLILFTFDIKYRCKQTLNFLSLYCLL